MLEFGDFECTEELVTIFEVGGGLNSLGCAVEPAGSSGCQSCYSPLLSELLLLAD